MDQNTSLADLRHSCAHLLAAAVKSIWPHAQPTLGPSTAEGFYYDFDIGDEKISDADLTKIEKEMVRIVKSWESFSRREVHADEARKEFANNKYKLELIDEIVSKGEVVTLYQSGSFVDLCRGGHIQNPRETLLHFKLMSVAGAYWRGDEKNTMLTRIYGTAFFTKEELGGYLTMLEEAKKRDHKKLGRDLDLFTFSELVGGGLPLWTPKGTLVRDILDDFVWKLRKEKGYQKVTIPHITKKDLYETSGHWAKFEQELFKIETREGHTFAMKPMNCPHHTQIYAHLPRSYRDLPQRYAETTMVYRDEQSGELAGLSRVRCITQDDAHVFCRKSQIATEASSVWDIVDTFYGAFGFELHIRLSFHDPNNMSAYLGTEALWQEAEQALEGLATQRGATYEVAPGEAAFYGPKIDFMAKDSLGRQWQVATIQLDVNMPERFDLHCTNEAGEKERIVMIHCAIMGSIERFTSVLIEHYAGAFPLWLAPVQVALLPISENHHTYAMHVAEVLQKHGVRIEVDCNARSIGAKIRLQTLQKVPYMGIMGDKEVSADAVSLRSRSGQDMGQMSVDTFVQKLISEIENRT